MTGSSDEAPIRSTVNAVGAPESLTHPTSLPVPPMSPLSSRVPLPEADVSRELPEVGTAPNVMDAIRWPLRSAVPPTADCFTQLVLVESYLNKSPRDALVRSVVPS